MENDEKAKLDTAVVQGSSNPNLRSGQGQGSSTHMARCLQECQKDAQVLALLDIYRPFE